MIKSYLIVLCFSLAVLRTSAQSQTFQIENIIKGHNLLPTISPSALYKNIEKDFVKLSLTDPIINYDTHPVIMGYLIAYQKHYPLTISPDIAWLLICQGFANHINFEPEKFRSRLAGFNGKKTLTVERDMSAVKDLTAFNWETTFPEFTAQIAKYAGKEIIQNLSADFTTTTPTSLVASQITIMETMKEFYNYKYWISGCGISEVTVEGTVKDWEKILKRLDYLEGYDLKWWTDELKPIIQKIIDTKEGKVDKQFWMNMVKYHTETTYGTPIGIDGWFLKFYPYLQTRFSPAMAKEIEKSKSTNKIVNIPVGYTGNPSDKSKQLYVQRSDFKYIASVSALPKEISNVPFTLEITDQSGKATQSYKLEFWAGFMGVKQDPVTFSMKPEIAWAVNRKNE